MAHTAKDLEQETMKKISLFGLVAASIALTSVTSAKADKDIVDIAAGDKNFSTLVSLVKQADLVDTLKGEGPFTVFAPTNAAFAKLPKSLLQKVSSDKKLLTQVLTYHVVAGNVMSKDLRNGMRAKTVQGENISVKISGKKVKFNNAGLVKADIKASNGVIHVIDTVILPPSIAKGAKTN
jgi:uncharacterized surface protein with fasciclin (FAS1) repeats